MTDGRQALSAGRRAPWTFRIPGSLVLALALAAGAAPADASEGTDWTVGRTSEVFRSHSGGIATRVGGWFDASYEDSNGDADRSINVNHLNLYADTRFRDQWQAFAEVEYEHESSVGGYPAHRAYEVEQLFGRYLWSDTFEVQFGRFNTPFGYWTPIHWTILMDSVQPPIHENQHLTPEQQHGFALRGHVYPSGERGPVSEFSYAVYAGYGSDQIGLRQSGNEGWATGVDLRVGLGKSDFAGVSLYRQKRELNTARSDRSERSLSLYAQSSLSDTLTLIGEYILQVRGSQAGPRFATRLGVGYGILRWQFHPKYSVSYRFNWGDDDLELGTDTRSVHSLTLGYNPTRSLRLKLEFADHSFRDDRQRGFRYWAFSVGGLF